MFNKIVGTIFTKILTAVIGFLVIMITTRTLGAEVRADVALILLNITFVGLIQGVFNGAVLIYATPRHSTFSLFVMINIISLIIASTLPFAFVFFKLLEPNQLYTIVGLTIFQGLLTTSQSLLLGYEDIKSNNKLEISKSIILLVAILIFFWSFNLITLESIIYAYYLSYIIPFVISLIMVLPRLKRAKTESVFSIFKSVFKFGSQMQISNVSQIINYRICFFFIEKWKGKDALGIFSIATAIAEAIWIISKSIITFQYTKIVNSQDLKEQTKITISSIHLCFIVTIPLLLILLVIPDSIYTSIFGGDIIGVQYILCALAVGILEFSILLIINHYFSGIGKNKVNILSSLLGNISIIAFGIMLIPALGSIGAGIATSITYFTMLAYLIYKFLKESKSKFKDLIPSKSSIQTLIQELKH